MKSSRIAQALALVLLGAALAPLAQGQIVSDDFDHPSLNTSLWTYVDPVGDVQDVISGYGTTDVVLLFAIPQSQNGHDSGVANLAPRLLQQAPNSDFEVSARWESIPATVGQQEGILVYDPTGNNFLRFCIQSVNGTLMAYMLEIQNGNSTSYYSGGAIHIVSLQTPGDGTSSGIAYLKLQRKGDTWTFSISPDGAVWETVYQPIQQPWTVAQVGPYAADIGSGFVAALDYFFNDASPIVNEDGQDAPPLVALTAPADQAAFTAPTNVVLGATATNPNPTGSVSKVEFYAGASLIGTAATSPYTFTWNNPPSGLYAISATATDSDGLTQSTPPVAVLIYGPGGPPALDDFTHPPLNTSLWTAVDPLADDTVQVASDGHLEIAVVGGLDHDAQSLNLAVSVIQPVPDTNFQVSAKFDTVPSIADQFEGLIVEDDSGDYLVFNALSDGSGKVKAFVGSTGSQVSSTTIADVPLPKSGNSGTVFLRVRRFNDRWTFSTSPDGAAWTVQYSYVQPFAAGITQVGVIAGNHDPSGNNNPPPFTARVRLLLQ